MRPIRFGSWACLLAVFGACAAPPRVSIADFGAVGDGTTLNTAALARAVKACADAGGGTVTVPPGRFLTGAFELASRITLRLETGAVLVGSPDLEQYRIGGRAKAALVGATGAADVSIVGAGTIEGSGTTYMEMDRIRTQATGSLDFDPKFTRQGMAYMGVDVPAPDGPVIQKPHPGGFVEFRDCRNVALRGVHLLDAPTWSVHMDGCRDVELTGLEIRNSLLIPNCDGVHFTNSRDVRIADCTIVAGDDAIAITNLGGRRRKAAGLPPAECRNVRVSRCVLQSRSAAVRVGYTGGDIRDCVFEDLDIRESNRGLCVNVRDEGSVENLRFANVRLATRLHSGHWWGKGEPIHVSAVRGSEGKVGRLGRIRGVRFENDSGTGEGGCVIWGCAESPIRDVVLENVALRFKNSPLNGAWGGNIDLRTAADPAEAMFKADVPGLYARHVEGLAIRGLKMDWAGPMPEFFTEAVRCERFKGLTIEGLEASPPQAQGTGIALDDGADAAIRNCRAGKGTGVFVRHTGLTGDLQFTGNDVSAAEKAMAPDGGGWNGGGK